MKSTDIKDVGFDYAWLSDSPVGEKDRAWIHLQDTETIKKLSDRISLLEIARDREQQLLELTLNALGIDIKTNTPLLWLLCSELLQRIVIKNDGSYVAIESVDGYIKKATDIQTVFPKEYVEQFTNLLNGCYQVIDGKIVLDEDKLNAMIGSAT